MEAHVWSFLFLIPCVCFSMGAIAQKRNSTSGNSSVVNVGGLFTFNSVIGRSISPAILAAVEDVNSDTTVLKNRKINLIVQDTNCSGFIGTVEGDVLFFLCFNLISLFI